MASKATGTDEGVAMHAVLVGLVAAAIVVYVIGRQLIGEPMRGKRLIVLPLILTVVGLTDLNSTSHPLRAADIGCLAVGAVIVAAIGLAQGRAMRLESRDAVLWVQLPAKGLWLWLVLVASRLAMTGIAVGLHAHVAGSTTPILLLLGVNRMAQAAIVATRAVRAGIPFAPEKDGNSLLSGMFPAQRTH
jgi:hypothetical protein